MVKEDIVEFYSQNFDELSLAALKTGIYIDNLRRGEKLDDYDEHTKKLSNTFSNLSEKNIRNLAPPETVALMDFFDPDRKNSSYEYIKEQSLDFAKELLEVKNLPKEKQKGLVKKCSKLHDILLYKTEKYRRYKRRHRFVA